MDYIAEEAPSMTAMAPVYQEVGVGAPVADSVEQLYGELRGIMPQGGYRATASDIMRGGLGNAFGSKGKGFSAPKVMAEAEKRAKISKEIGATGSVEETLAAMLETIADSVDKRYAANPEEMKRMWDIIYKPRLTRETAVLSDEDIENARVLSMGESAMGGVSNPIALAARIKEAKQKALDDKYKTQQENDVMERERAKAELSMVLAKDERGFEVLSKLIPGLSDAIVQQMKSANSPMKELTTAYTALAKIPGQYSDEWQRGIQSVLATANAYLAKAEAESDYTNIVAIQSFKRTILEQVNMAATAAPTSRQASETDVKAATAAWLRARPGIEGAKIQASMNEVMARIQASRDIAAAANATRLSVANMSNSTKIKIAESAKEWAATGRPEFLKWKNEHIKRQQEQIKILQGQYDALKTKQGRILSKDADKAGAIKDKIDAYNRAIELDTAELDEEIYKRDQGVQKVLEGLFEPGEDDGSNFDSGLL